MSHRRDQRLLEYLLGELGLWRRLGVRLRLALSAATRRRLTELEAATSVIGGSFGGGRGFALAANNRVRLKRLAVVDAVVALAMIGAVATGAAAVWHAAQPAPAPTNLCPIDGSGPGGATTPKHRVQRIQIAR